MEGWSGKMEEEKKAESHPDAMFTKLMIVLSASGIMILQFNYEGKGKNRF